MEKILITGTDNHIGTAYKHFNRVVLRSSVIYGEGCKKIYPVFSETAWKVPDFPFARNERLILYTENMFRFICLMTEIRGNGIFHFQNNGHADADNEYADTNNEYSDTNDGYADAIETVGKTALIYRKKAGSKCSVPPYEFIRRMGKSEAI